MERFKWLAIAALSIVAALSWHQLTGSWTSSAIALAATGITLNLFFGGNWPIAGLAAAIGVFAMLNTTGSGSVMDVAKKPTAVTGQAPAQLSDLLPKFPQMGSNKAPTPPPTGGAEPADTDVGSAPASAPSAAKTTTPVSDDKRVKDCPDCPEMTVIAAGQFLMGRDAKPGETPPNGGPLENPRHRVVLRSFMAGSTAVTKAEFAAFVKAAQYKTEAETSGGCFSVLGGEMDNKRNFQWRDVGFVQADDHPVVCVSWNDTQAYLQWLSQTTGHPYRLLSEAEREYVGRAGSETLFWWGDTLTTARANYDTSAPDYHGSMAGIWRKATVAARSFEANAFGLFNVHGNVWEWTQDCLHPNYVGAPADGSAWTTKCQQDKRLLRGGAWVGDPTGLRATYRSAYTPDFRSHAIGFRVARDLALKK